MHNPEQGPSVHRIWFAKGVRPFFLALSFLSRLSPPLRASPEEMSASALYYPLVGALLGAVFCFPLSIGLFAGHPWVQAWLYILFSVWLTRALHLDGLADICDALGSGKTGDAFRVVLKDSRIGAFGATGLTLALGGQIILAATILQSGKIAPLLFAPLYGRCLPIALASLVPPFSETGLGSLLFSDTLKTPALLLAAVCALCGSLFCLSLPSFLLCLLFTAPALVLLVRLARREKGYSGDFFGCLIVAGETAVLLAAVAI